jgi:glucose/arabinose dehydrogenase
MKQRVGLLIALAVLVFVASVVFVLARGDSAKLPETASEGPSPTLPEPNKRLIPTVHIAPAKGWTDGAKPVAAPGLEVSAFATDLQHPRWLYVLPDGGVLVAESDGPPRPEEGKGVKGFVYKTVQKRAGSGTPSANRITLLSPAGNAGTATKTTFLEGLNSPFGMALVGNELYVANTDDIMRFPYTQGATRISETGVKLADLPGGPLNHH